MSEILKDYQDLFIAVVAVAGVIFTAWIALQNNNKNLLIKTVTEERAKWRSELRNACAEFVKLTSEHVGNANVTNTPRIRELKTHLQLRLNPSQDEKHKLDQDIIQIIKDIVSGLDAAGSKQTILDNLNDLELYVQQLLKAEWEKSKKEAKTGKLETDL
ncbi:hypothetical protein DNG97_24390 [Vibrio parahaemolyticus]|nr:hypothetical protein [Vibrio parahaemolyticus]EHH2556928.1 hypothetical protein [Vibrio parahaemolyticus]EHK2857707.1 hypothetical protein [Vibrio parahaemolyticus]